MYLLTNLLAYIHAFLLLSLDDIEDSEEVRALQTKNEFSMRKWLSNVTALGTESQVRLTTLSRRIRRPTTLSTCLLTSRDTVRHSLLHFHTWQIIIIFTIFTIITFIFSYSLIISLWTQDLALQQILSSTDLFLSYQTDYTDSRTI